MFLDAEASQENFKRPEMAPKRHQRDTQRDPKIGQKVVQKWTQKLAKNGWISYSKYRADRSGSGGFLGHGASKNAYFEDVKKLFKMPQNDPKMIQTWFKIAQIV